MIKTIQAGLSKLFEEWVVGIVAPEALPTQCLCHHWRSQSMSIVLPPRSSPLELEFLWYSEPVSYFVKD